MESSRRYSYSVQPIAWNSEEGAVAREIRLKVFVDEQNVPVAEEIDDIDPQAFHVLAYGLDDMAVGTARLYPDPENRTCARIGRMAVLAEARGTGCGSALLTALLAEAKLQGYTRAALSGQEHAVGFYEKHGFRVTGSRYYDAGIPHFKMMREL